ncbi:MAG: hypothetical protein IJV40_15775 [Oscillospiraceae bacterium]|nr:hypothetical protein [Oscillospiraceae bacterium]
MSTLESIVSMLETMPEEARIQVFEFTQNLFSSYKPANPFMKKSTADILSDLEISRKQAEQGECMRMKAAIESMGKQHGFI